MKNRRVKGGCACGMLCLCAAGAFGAWAADDVRAGFREIGGVHVAAGQSVTAGAKLALDYPGTVTVRSLRLGTTPVRGTVTAADYPDYLTGMGAICVKPAGMAFFLR